MKKKTTPRRKREDFRGLALRIERLEQQMRLHQSAATHADVPLDAESARVAEQHRETMARKRAGETGIRWNADPRIRYRECALIHPNARVHFRQLAPVDDDNVPSLHVSLARDYDELVAHLRDNHWRGGRASYKWTVSDDNQPQWATGIIQFETRGDQAQLQPPHPPPGTPPIPGWYNGMYWTGRDWLKPPMPPPSPIPPPSDNVVGIKKG